MIPALPAPPGRSCEPDELEQALGELVRERLRTGEWAATAVMGGPALEPIAKGLKKYELASDLESTVVVVLRRKP